MTDPAEIAKGLTEAEALAMKGVFAWTSFPEQLEGEQKLYALGLWNPQPKYGDQTITPLGLSVRAVLQEKG
jgi:hypothetical protein